MSDKKITETPRKSSLAGGDLFPLAAAGDAAAYSLDWADLPGSIPTSSTTLRGSFRFTTQDHVKYPSPTYTRAVCPQDMSQAVNARHFQSEFPCLDIGSYPLTRALIDAAFLAAAGREQQRGDLVTVRDDMDNFYLLAWNSTRAQWRGIDCTTPGFCHF
jgi:hypothetical protein